MRRNCAQTRGRCPRARWHFYRSQIATAFTRPWSGKKRSRKNIQVPRIKSTTRRVHRIRSPWRRPRTRYSVLISNWRRHLRSLRKWRKKSSNFWRHNNNRISGAGPLSASGHRRRKASACVRRLPYGKSSKRQMRWRKTYKSTASAHKKIRFQTHSRAPANWAVSRSK